MKGGAKKTKRVLLREIEELERRLEEAETTLHAIREGEVDAIVVSGTAGEQVFSLGGSDFLYRIIVETMKEAALTVTFDGRVLFCNDQFGQFVKRPLERIVGHNLAEFVSAEDAPVLKTMLQASQRAGGKCHLVFAGPAGAMVPSHVSATVLNAPDGVGICLVATDLTDLEASTEMLQQLREQKTALKRASDALAKVNAELEDRVRERTMALKRTVDALEREVQERRLGELRLVQANEELGHRADTLRRLARELSRAEQKERRRLAHVLHDDLQQILVAAQLRLSTLEGSLHEPTRKVTAIIADWLSQAVDVSRSLTVDLSPPVIYEAGLVAGLKWLAHFCEERYGLAVEVAADGEAVEDDESLRVFLFGAVRELLFNVVKHAKTKRAVVSLKETRGTLTILVEDQGIGFDPHLFDTDPGAAPGFGLLSIRERLGLFGGSFHVESTRKTGSRFTMTVPLRTGASVSPSGGRDVACQM